ncbi:MAG: class I SAM-dependent methyltransferase [Pirellulaceae bacterium]|nr:class I SAM-dependent methyltransferase [Pirellulaceae bacterium]
MNYPFLSKRSQVYSQLSMEILRNHITASDRVLDVGSGPGFVAQRIHEELGAEVQCLDVVDLNKTNFTMTLFDGENIPFEDNHFSVSLGLYMLHHARESAHLELLREMKRVTSSKIIISEDLAYNWFDRGLQKFHEIESKIDFKSDKLTFRSQSGWQQLFERVGLEISDVIDIPRKAAWWYPIRRCYFVLNS